MSGYQKNLENLVSTKDLNRFDYERLSIPHPVTGGPVDRIVIDTHLSFVEGDKNFVEYSYLKHYFYEITRPLWLDCSVLDMACGSGYDGKILSEIDKNTVYVGFDLDSWPLKRFPENRRLKNVHFIRSDIFSDFPFHVKFDRILNLWFVTDKKQHVETALKYLKEDGLYIHDVGEYGSNAFQNIGIGERRRFLEKVSEYLDPILEVWLDSKWRARDKKFYEKNNFTTEQIAKILERDNHYGVLYMILKKK